MDGIVYITLDQAKDIHRKTIQYSGGGTYEHFDLGRLDSVLQHIQNDDYYPTFEDKITHLFFCTCKFHCFADGNKRLAITLSAQFLLFNGYMAVAKRFFTVMENISYHVAAGRIDKDLLHRIIVAVMDGTYDSDEELKLAIIEAIQKEKYNGMSYDYSENILVQESAGNLLRDELGWDVKFAYNTEVLGDNGSFPSYY